MDLDKEFVRSVIKDGLPGYKLAVDKGITDDHLLDEGKVAWKFLVTHYKQYGEIPSKELVIANIVDSKGVPLDLSAGLSDGTAVLLDKVLDRRMINILTQGGKQVLDKASQRDTKGALEAWQEVHRKIQREAVTISKVESLFAMGREVIDYYELMKSGVKGIPTPWPSMDEQTMGWWPEDLILIVGRLGVGKSWTLLLLSHAAWAPGHKVLICTTEMSRRALAQRFLAIHFKLPYGDFRRGKLGMFIEQKMKDGIAAMMADQGVRIVGNDFDYSIDSLDAAVEDEKPEMLVVDGAYLIKNIGKDRHERTSNTFDDFKRIGKRRKISVASSTQFNRTAKAGQEESISADNIGITDVAGWNADAAFGVFQTQDMFDQSIMGIKGLKVREGKPQSFQAEWNLNSMVFSEISDPSKIQPTNLPPAIVNAPDKDDDMPDIPF